jgi:hypothetical protein
LNALERDAVTQRRCDERWADEVGGGVADQSELEWGERRQRVTGFTRSRHLLRELVELDFVERMRCQPLQALSKILWRC